MSRIGKKPIKIPAGVEININGREAVVKGPKGQLEKEFPEILDIKVSDGMAHVNLKEGLLITRQESQIWGLGRALLSNMIKGVSENFETILEFNGIGFKAQVKGDSLELNLGYTNPVRIKAPAGVIFQVEKSMIKITGIDKQAVGHVAALVRAARPPEPYKGTGIKYKDEVIRRKAGKKAVATAG
jgi:large subunit ribosomal protein L6